MKKIIARFAADQSGAMAVEYGLIAGLIAVVIISAVTSLGNNASSKISAIAANLK